MSTSLWVEKYRPRTLNDVADQKEIVETMKSYVKTLSLTHCLFGGPAGVGKTTVALCVANEIFGKTMKYNFKELNASDERGINTVRFQIKDFAQTSPYGGMPFKILFLSEVDAMSPDAQWALRRIIEINEKQCRFILDCNYISKVIPALQSRCTPFRFKPLPKEDAINRLEFIAKCEGFNPNRKALELIYANSVGDMRYMINVLQSAALRGHIDEDTVSAVIGLIQPEKVEKMIVLANSGKFKEARDILHDLLYRESFSGQDLTRAIFSFIVDTELIAEGKKDKLILKLAEIDKNIASGASEVLQLASFLALCGIGD